MTRILIFSLVLVVPALGFAQCGDQLLVSDYTANQVHVFDGCDGSYLRGLDTQGVLRGPQAIVDGNDGFLYVVSEENNRVVRFRRDDLGYHDTLISSTTGLGGLSAPTGLALDSNGNLLVAGFASDNIVRFDRSTGNPLGTFATLAGAGLDGPDAGLLVRMGQLYVPNFENSTISVLDLETGALDSQILSDGSPRLNNPRVLVSDPQTQDIYLSNWGSSQIIRIAADGTRSALAGVFRPSGLALDERNRQLIVVSDGRSAITRIDLETGESDTFVAAGPDNPIQAATFALLLTSGEPPQPAVSASQWIVGDGSIANGVLRIDTAVTGAGTVFGAQFNASDVELVPWGALSIEFTDCNEAVLSWESTDPGIGSGGYPLFRLLNNGGQALCETNQLQDGPDFSWIAGTWYGGNDRAGEGILIDTFDANRAFAAWFTYPPAAGSAQ